MRVPATTTITIRWSLAAAAYRLSQPPLARKGNGEAALLDQVILSIHPNQLEKIADRERSDEQAE